MKLLVINGPNLNLTGLRKTDIYGTQTLSEINAEIKAYAAEKGVSVTFFQSNHEGALIDTLQAARGQYAGAVLNAGAYTHYSYALRDAVEAVSDSLPVAEVHMSDITAREDFRKISVLRDVCVGQIYGHGKDSYKMGIDLLLKIL